MRPTTPDTTTIKTKKKEKEKKWKTKRTTREDKLESETFLQRRLGAHGGLKRLTPLSKPTGSTTTMWQTSGHEVPEKRDAYFIFFFFCFPCPSNGITPDCCRG
mmetsp:Transcript_10829/g.12439  ORF Transcript_10829/g.12439 Transcript_10829/m.12439 type:complete len:103 (-) Transcript_10829:268-576(-)